jgi:DNA-binding PadR family transcriptional regulator
MATSDLDTILPLTPTVFHVLVALAAEAKHGYAIAREVEELTEGHVVMGPGTLYGSLQRMTEAGLIKEAENPCDRAQHAARRRYYATTPLGQAALRAESERMVRALAVVRERMGA